MTVARSPVLARVIPTPRRRARSVSLVAPQPDRDAMPTNDELEQCILAVAEAADRQAFAVLFKHYAPRVKGFLMRSGCAPDVAEDVAQETMVAVWRKAQLYDPARAALSTWIFTIARNLRIDHARRAHEDASGGAPEEDSPDFTDDARPEDELLAAQRWHGVRRALERLPADQAQVLRLSFFDERPHARIARELAIPLGTVKSRIRLAVAQLRRLLADLAP